MDGVEDNMKNIRDLLIDAVMKDLPDEGIGVLFSGGVDSSVISLILQQHDVRFTCYTSGVKAGRLETARDVDAARLAEEAHGFPVKIFEEDFEDIESDIKDVISIINSRNIIKVGVGLALYVAMREAKKDGIKAMFSGLGSEEIFAGYERHRLADDINEECRNGLAAMKERDLDRDNALANHFDIELKAPFLDPELVEFALKIPGEEKISEGQNKLILRKVAESIGLDKRIAYRKKLGAQYGSKFDRAILRLAKDNGYKKKTDYLQSL